ncbi:DUF1156 domain-containing protein [Capillibacterium thermochitinicola]|uniref:DUF1156 domain-containing protein n=1 Tax=Capillibacterium thermochitinicola TaxID=2699427 RepID=A0A8J6I0L7_9FIRM|nr:DUF1156 domain-containing protein [Capillibacterium thermochitinicola]MBA2133540.1 DUF1156 domain-containing protein [Capillibacterium thermochitinicola]
MTVKKKLIEVTLPLETINRESAREKSIRHGHPSTLHLWWSRKPLSTCRAVLFASLVDDPSVHPEKFPSVAEQQEERERLFKIIEDLVKWENINNEKVLNRAREEILKSTGGNPPPVLDPFCGGGSIPLEAQRLGLEAHGSDLNPVAVMITKALIEIPPKFAGRLPVNPQARSSELSKGSWPGAQGLAADIRYYGEWMREEAEKRIGHLYPKVKLPPEYGGGEATVIAWLWARTVQCPNPACGVRMPLVSSFWLSTKRGEKAWAQPVIDQEKKEVCFKVRTGDGAPPKGTVNRQGAKCIFCNSPVPFAHIRKEGQARRMGSQLMAIVAEGNNRRVYLSSDDKHASIIAGLKPSWKPDQELPYNPRDFKTPNYGMVNFGDLFTPRQLTALTTFSDLVTEAGEKIYHDAVAAGYPDDVVGLEEGGSGARAYAEAVCVYLAFGVNRLADRCSSICSWDIGYTKIRNTFARQAIPMTWDYAEGNPFSASTGNFLGAIEWVAKVVESSPCTEPGYAQQYDAVEAITLINKPLISTDPPYYDNIGYADLSDFFYIWLRRSLKNMFPSVLSTLLTPKEKELVATPYRFDGSKEKAKEFFETGLERVFTRMRENHHPDYPLTLYYAFKQSEVDDSDGKNGTSPIASTGWETMLEGLVEAGFSITGTWPMRSELSNRTVARGANALASSIVLVCRPRPENAPSISRRELITALKKELPEALRQLQQGNIAPVDLAQAAIGPGMAVFSRYAQVLEADGSPMPVRTALQIINQLLDEFLAEQEGEYDPETRWAVAWFEQMGHKEGLFGTAETLSKAKNTSIQRMVDRGFLEAKAGKVRLLRREEFPVPLEDFLKNSPTVWEVTQQLTRVLMEEGESAAALWLEKLGALSEGARSLSYYLYSICERKGWAQEALAYNTLVTSWPRLRSIIINKYKQQQQGALALNTGEGGTTDGAE